MDEKPLRLRRFLDLSRTSKIHSIDIGIKFNAGLQTAWSQVNKKGSGSQRGATERKRKTCRAV